MRCAALGGQGDILALLQRVRVGFFNAERDRNRPWDARRQPHLVAAAGVVCLAHETRERRESP